MGTIKSLKDYMQNGYVWYKDLNDYAIEDLLQYGDYEEISKKALETAHFGHIVDLLDRLETNRFSLSLWEIQRSIQFHLNHIVTDLGGPEVVLIVGNEILTIESSTVGQIIRTILKQSFTGFGDINTPPNMDKENNDPDDFMIDFYPVNNGMVEISFQGSTYLPMYFTMAALVDSFNQYFTLGEYYDLPEDEWEEQED